MSIHFPQVQIPKPSHLNGELWTLKNLNKITIIFGRNGSGKSKLLRNLSSKDASIFHYIVPERSGELQLDVNTSQLELEPSNRAKNRRKNYSTTYNQEAVSRIQTLFIKSGFLGMGDQTIRVKRTEIESLLQSLMPGFEFKITEKNPYYELKRTDTNNIVRSINHLSSGEAQILGLGLDLLTMCSLWELSEQHKRVLLIDEPDTHLHPDLQQHLGKFIVKLTEIYNTQIIIATHSTTLLSAIGYHGQEKTSVIYLNNSIEEQNAIKFEKSLQELSTCLGGHALMGPLFGAPLLLVEGDDDYKIWSHIPRYHKVKIAVIPCNGAQEVKKYQKTLEKLFTSISNDNRAVGYALLDGDQSLPEPGSPPQNHVKFIKLACEESENLYLTNEVLLALGTNWEDATKKIKQESKNYGQKQDLLNQCDQWDRKKCDIKKVINELAQILDPKKIPWTSRIADLIGREKPEGQLKEFLGDNVIQAFWN